MRQQGKKRQPTHGCCIVASPEKPYHIFRRGQLPVLDAARRPSALTHSGADDVSTVRLLVVRVQSCTERKCIRCGHARRVPAARLGRDLQQRKRGLPPAARRWSAGAAPPAPSTACGRAGGVDVRRGPSSAARDQRQRCVGAPSGRLMRQSRSANGTVPHGHVRRNGEAGKVKTQ